MTVTDPQQVLSQGGDAATGTGFGQAGQGYGAGGGGTATSNVLGCAGGGGYGLTPAATSKSSGNKFISQSTPELCTEQCKLQNFHLCS